MSGSTFDGHRPAHPPPVVSYASAAMKKALDLAIRGINVKATLLLMGPSGAGKGHLAREAHLRSSRGKGAFVVCSLADIQESLVQGELFGHVRSAYTGAERDRQGIFRSGEGGTVLLDDVDKSSVSTQACLLRFLDDRRVRPVGSDEAVPVDAQIIAATNQNLGELADRGRFLPDLRWRVAQVVIHIPPLNERREDIVPLIASMLGEYTALRGWPAVDVVPGALQAFEGRSWPGNVRELASALMSAVLLTQGRPLTQEIAEEVCGGGDTRGSLHSRLEELSRMNTDERRSRHAILLALDVNRWRIGKAAKTLGVPLRTFQRDCKKYAISHESR